MSAGSSGFIDKRTSGKRRRVVALVEIETHIPDKTMKGVECCRNIKTVM